MNDVSNSDYHGFMTSKYLETGLRMSLTVTPVTWMLGRSIAPGPASLWGSMHAWWITRAMVWSLQCLSVAQVKPWPKSRLLTGNARIACWSSQRLLTFSVICWLYCNYLRLYCNYVLLTKSLVTQKICSWHYSNKCAPGETDKFMPDQCYQLKIMSVEIVIKAWCF